MLSYDPGALLNVVSAGATDEREDAGASVDLPPQQVGSEELVCKRTDFTLLKNFDQVAILRPTSGIVWPGALVKGNSTLLDGAPEPLPLPRAPLTVRVNLPGMGVNGTRTVDNPTNSSVQAAIDEALEWWNGSAYQEGYVNASQSSFQLSQSYSSEQVALKVGLNAAWASGDAAVQFSYHTSEEKTVVLAVYKQAFYDVTLDTPGTPESVFDGTVSLEDVQDLTDNATPPAYVASVTYGRIIMARMETSAKLERAELEAAARHAFAAVEVSGEVEASYNKLNKNLSIQVVTLGGNAAVATQAINTSSPADLISGIQSVIQGENAVYSRDNPGIPIAYQVRFLKDNSLAKMGFTTEYTSTECTATKNRSLVKITLDRFHVVKDCDGIEGAGDFHLYAGIYENSSGSNVLRTDHGFNGQLNDNENVSISKSWTVELPHTSASRFSAYFRSYETDQDIFGSTWHDDRMGDARTTAVHQWQAGGWTNLGPTGGSRTITHGSGDCQAQLIYTVSIQ
jgi:thiol-activated cytolysin